MSGTTRKYQANINILESEIQKLKSIITRLDQLKEKTNSTKNEISLYWDGAAAQEYLTKLNSNSNKQTDNLKKCIQELVSYTNSCIHELKEADKFYNKVLSDMLGLVGYEADNDVVISVSSDNKIKVNQIKKKTDTNNSSKKNSTHTGGGKAF